ncbi:hypothetical protein S40285_07176 [Stachybotrys chlorohalonatus IBT 40285]|uniref:RING-type domain-containing protein n=1 Tax=Stachybotrys chlorohalonatus (strain IBT 40285) TaxID=1283841 RepID=A0A084QPV2_STAC4|nr:hypothetical protein S40285_07176 [Stachybotrys chlorohalonata IBT 40285]
MSPELPEVAETRTPTGPEGIVFDRNTDTEVHYPLVTLSQVKNQARDLVRLFQCRACSRPLREPVTLPCGRSVCRSCIPEPHVRANITYPALPGRQHGFHCPVPDCGKEHALGDCAVDVILNKAVERMAAEIRNAMLEATQSNWSTHIAVQDSWQVAGVASLQDADDHSQVLSGGRLVATWNLMESGFLDFDAEVSYKDVSTPSVSVNEIELWETDHVRNVQVDARLEMDCQICYALFYDPLTTACGHTFCRSCLHRILDHSRYCPICRRKLAINPLLSPSSYPSNGRLGKMIETFWADELHSRRQALEAEQTDRHRDFDTALFICTLSFPLMPTFLHVFEPRYRLMIRRALEGDGTFGMVLPRRTYGSGDAPFYELGTLLRVVNVQRFPDGRSLIETKGVSRFRVLRHGIVDGYTVGRTERIEDVSVEEEEALEASEVGSEARDGIGASKSTSDDDEVRMPETVAGLEALPTRSLMRIAAAFVERMRAQSVPWLTERVLEMYPEDPAVFPWWFASMLPVKDQEKYRLLGTASVRERLKICCAWILEWESNRW